MPRLSLEEDQKLMGRKMAVRLVKKKCMPYNGNTTFSHIIALHSKCTRRMTYLVGIKWTYLKMLLLARKFSHWSLTDQPIKPNPVVQCLESSTCLCPLPFCEVQDPLRANLI
jgi:hypothetical protein